MLGEEMGGEIEEMLVFSITGHVWTDEGGLGWQHGLQFLLEVKRGKVDFSPLWNHSMTQVTEPFLAHWR